jgi:hypothetical protein
VKVDDSKEVPLIGFGSQRAYFEILGELDSDLWDCVAKTYPNDSGRHKQQLIDCLTKGNRLIQISRQLIDCPDLIDPFVLPIDRLSQLIDPFVQTNKSFTCVNLSFASTN